MVLSGKENRLVNAPFMPPSLPASTLPSVGTFAEDAVTHHLFQISNNEGTINEVPSPGGGVWPCLEKIGGFKDSQVSPGLTRLGGRVSGLSWLRECDGLLRCEPSG